MHQLAFSMFDFDEGAANQFDPHNFGGTSLPIPDINATVAQFELLTMNKSTLANSDGGSPAIDLEMRHKSQLLLAVPDYIYFRQEKVALGSQLEFLEIGQVSCAIPYLKAPSNQEEIPGVDHRSPAAAAIEQTSTPSTAIESEPLTSFTCFEKFPLELQRMVRKLAVYVPTVTTLNLEDLHCLSRTSISARIHGFNIGESNHLIAKRPLLTTCRTSQACALEEYGAPYTFEFRTTDSEDDKTLTSTWIPGFQLYLTNSPTETFYFPREEGLDDSRRFWRIVRGGKVQHSVIRSLALGNVRARLLDEHDLARLSSRNGVWRNKDIRVLGTMSCFWPPSPQLEASTLVDLKVVEGSSWEKHRRDLGATWISSERNFEILVMTLDERLGRYAADIQRGAAEGPRGCTWGAWWKEPKVTVASEADSEGGNLLKGRSMRGEPVFKEM